MMKHTRRNVLRLATGSIALPAAQRVARAQAYPSRLVRIVVGFPAGGAADTIVRLMAQWLSDRLGQPFVVENRPGAATNLSVHSALTSPPDGYSLVFIATSTAINTTLYDTLSVNFLRDGSSVAGLVRLPHVIASHPSLPARTVPELIAYARANAGRVNVASYGTGTTSHLANELFKSMADVPLVHVPYRGDAQAIPDLLSGRVQLYFATLTATLPHIRSGALRALAVLGRTRYEGLPDVPTVGESVSGYEVDSFTGIGVRKGTPQEIIERLNREVNAGLADAALRARFRELAAVPFVVGPSELHVHMAAAAQKWAEVIRAAHIKPE